MEFDNIDDFFEEWGEGDYRNILISFYYSADDNQWDLSIMQERKERIMHVTISVNTCGLMIMKQGERLQKFAAQGLQAVRDHLRFCRKENQKEMQKFMDRVAKQNPIPELLKT